MKKIWKITSWILGIAFYVVLMAFVASGTDAVVVKKVEITVEQTGDQYFLSKELVGESLFKKNDTIVGKLLQEINIQLLEETLKANPYVEEGEVYSTLDGRVFVNVATKKAIARVISGNTAYYIDQHGNKMPLAKNYSAAVPIITGHITPQRISEVYGLLTLLTSSVYFQKDLAGLSCDAAGSWTVYPSFGTHTVKWGKDEENKIKLQKLEAFYAYLIRDKKLDQVASIDLQYEGQVVHTTH